MKQNHSSKYITGFLKMEIHVCLYIQYTLNINISKQDHLILTYFTAFCPQCVAISDTGSHMFSGKLSQVYIFIFPEPLTS